jgi:transcriptional regulator with XRE-family HTH domain
MIRIPAGTDLGEVISDMLELTGTRPAELARRTGFAEGQISKWRRGIVVPSAPVLMAIFDALGYDFAGAPRNRRAPETAARSTETTETPTAGVLGWAEGQQGAHAAPEVVELLQYALHLRQYGERAPGGNETWREFDQRAEILLRKLSGHPDVLAVQHPVGHGCLCDWPGGPGCGEA